MSVDESKETPKKAPKVEGACEIGTFLECATCKRCSLVCPTKVDIEKVARVARYLRDPKGSHRDVFKLTSKLSSMAETQKWLDVEGIEVSDSSDVAYFPGCSALFDVLLQRDTNYAGSAKAAVLVLNKLGIKPEIIYGCCGHDLYYSGSLDEFEVVKNEMLKKLEGKKQIVVGCGECYHMLKNVYGLESAVTFAEYVLDKNPEFVKTDLKTTYHDPCRLGRYNEIYDAPRELLKKASDFREMENIREEAICCSVSAWLNCNKESREVRKSRLEEAKATGADVMVTACTKCTLHLDCIHYEIDKEDVKELEDLKLLGLEQVVAYGMGLYDPFEEKVEYMLDEIQGIFTDPWDVAEKDLERYIDDDLIEQTFKCTSCKNCSVVCPVHFDTPGFLMETFRPELVKRGYGPEKHAKIAKVLAKTGNAYGEEGETIKENSDAEYVYFPGCTAQFRRQDVFEATTRILDMLGVKYEIPEGMVCCGSVLKRSGHDPSDLIKKNMEILKGKKIITTCAGCYSTLSKDYEGLDVRHITDIIKEHLSELPLKKVKKRVMYHDPCHLGRKFSYYDIPREIIEAVPGVELVPFELEKENAQCCGAGGGVKSGMPDLANELATKRMDEAKEKKADMVLSSCPFCELNLGDNSDIPVVDILNLLIESLEAKE